MEKKTTHCTLLTRLLHRQVTFRKDNTCELCGGPPELSGGLFGKSWCPYKHRLQLHLAFTPSSLVLLHGITGPTSRSLKIKSGIRQDCPMSFTGLSTTSHLQGFNLFLDFRAINTLMVSYVQPNLCHAPAPLRCFPGIHLKLCKILSSLPGIYLFPIEKEVVY